MEDHTYDAFRRLAKVKDWLGETSITRDALGRLQFVTDQENRKTDYEWGTMGERRSMTTATQFEIFISC